MTPETFKVGDRVTPTETIYTPSGNHAGIIGYKCEIIKIAKIYCNIKCSNGRTYYGVPLKSLKLISK